MIMELRSFSFFCIFSCLASQFAFADGAQTTRQGRNLVVKRGAEAVLNQDGLHDFANGSIVCRFEVLHDPICLRFGTLNSNGFTCAEAKSVLYLHSGSTISKTDCIKMKLLVFYEDRTIEQTIKIGVVVQDRPIDELLSIQVATVNRIGGTVSLGEGVLPPFVKKFLNSCSVTVLTSHWPLNGKVVLANSSTGKESLCTGFKATYFHDGSYIPNIDYVPLALSWKDADGKFKQMNYHMEVQIRGAQKNDAPILYSRRPRVMVKQYSTTQMKATNIRAIDYKTDPAKLLLKVTKPQRYDFEGFFSTIEDPETPLEGLTQDMIDNGRLVFVAPKSLQTKHRRSFIIQQFQLEAIDEYGAESKRKLRIAFFVQKYVAYYLSVVTNNPLRLLEGKSCKLATENIDILCPASNCHRGKFSVIGEPKNGGLYRNGRKTNQFMYGDLVRGNIVYRHDNSENLVDSIVISIMEQSQLALVTLNVMVESMDDSPPFLSVHKDIIARNGELTKIETEVLRASDPDSSLEDITFRCVVKPNGGSLKKDEQGVLTTVEEFSEVELESGVIFYHSLSKEPMDDHFVFVLSDKIPNLSKRYTARIKVRAADNMPPYRRYGGECLARMRETDASLSLNFIHYVDNVSPSSAISIMLLPQRRHDFSNVRHGSIVRIIGYRQLPATIFSQQELFHNKIFFLNTNGEVGMHAKNLRLEFVVSDGRNNTTPVQSCTVVIEPVDNKAPRVSVAQAIKALEGDRVCVNRSHIVMTDVDSEMTKLEFQVIRQPKYGRFVYEGKSISEDNYMKYLDLEQKCLWYYHDGSETRTDEFTISASDGVNYMQKEVKIEVKPLNDQRPFFLREKVELRVTENSTVVIDSDLLEAVDKDSEKSLLTFHVLDGSKLGYLQTKKDNEVRKFTQNDIDNALLVYSHRNREIGPFSVYDNFTVSVCDLRNLSKDCNSTTQVRVEVVPINSSPPSLMPGVDLIVEEGRFAAVGTNVFKCKDSDTLSSNIRIQVVKFPKFGYLENTAPSIGSEQSNAGVHISEFLCWDVEKSSVNYVQSNHSGFEPDLDSFAIIAFDGTFNSSIVTINVRISPRMDERPVVKQVAPIKLQEGSWIIIDDQHIRVTDKDNPKDLLKLYIVIGPTHGQMFYKCNGVGPPLLKRLPLGASIDYLHCALIYVHDDSESISDRIQIEVTDGKMASKATLDVDVVPVNDKMPEIVTNIAMTVRFGGFKDITRSYLAAHDLDSDATQLSYRLTKQPLYGSIKAYINGLPKRLLLNSTFTQDDLDKKRVSYVNHRMPVLGLTDKFRFDLSDGKNSIKNKTFAIRIRLSCRKHFKIKTKDVMSNGPKIFISSSNLRAQRRKVDGDSTTKSITFHIIRQPKYGVLSLDDNKKRKIITAVTEDELNKRQLVYRSFEYPRKKNDSLRFFATDGKCMQRGKLHILTMNTNITIDLMKRVSPLNVVSKGITSVTPLEVRSSDKYRPDKVIYRLKSLPRHGVMLKDGVNMSSFSQKDVNELRISYLLLNATAEDDELSIDVTAKDFYGLNLDSKPVRIILKISINIPSMRKVRVMANVPITSLAKTGQGIIGSVISKHNLLSLDCSSQPDPSLRYFVIEPPIHGELMFNDTGLQATSFTQGDINSGRLVYMLTDHSLIEYSDSLILDAESNGCQKLSGTEFRIKWSVVSLSDKIKVQCTNGRTLITVKLLRHGYVNQGSGVVLHLKSLPDRDESLTPARVWFHPGDKEKTFNVPEEVLEYEKVEMYIEKEFNTLLKRTKLTLDIAKLQDACSMERKKSGKDIAIVKAKSGKEGDSEKTNQFHDIALIMTSPAKRKLRFRGQKSTSLAVRKESKKRRNICSKGWVGSTGHCYYASDRATSWRKANKLCRKKHALLFTPSSVLEDAFVMKMMHGKAFWIGVKVGKKRNWKWNIRKMRQPFLRKLSKLEEGRTSNNLCIYVDGSGDWRLHHCKEKIASFVCKKLAI